MSVNQTRAGFNTKAKVHTAVAAEIAEFDICRDETFRAEMSYVLNREGRKQEDTVCLDKARKFCSLGTGAPGGKRPTAHCDVALMLVKTSLRGLDTIVHKTFQPLIWGMILTMQETIHDRGSTISGVPAAQPRRDQATAQSPRASSITASVRCH
jgi:hypothetical protein